MRNDSMEVKGVRYIKEEYEEIITEEEEIIGH